MKTFAVIFLASTLTGCATAPDWQHSSISDPATEERQFTIDHGYCLQVAHGSAPMPNIAYVPPNDSTFSGTYSAYNMQTGHTSGRFSGSTAGGSFAGGLSSGFASGYAIGAAIKARKAQDAIYDGCMTRLGWSEHE